MALKIGGIPRVIMLITHTNRRRKELKMLCSDGFKGLVDKVISMRVQLTNKVKYMGLLGHSTLLF